MKKYIGDFVHVINGEPTYVGLCEHMSDNDKAYATKINKIRKIFAELLQYI